MPPRDVGLILIAGPKRSSDLWGVLAPSNMSLVAAQLTN